MEYFKKIIRYFYYKTERDRISRERIVRKIQNQKLTENYRPEITKLVLFLVDGADWAAGRDLISGGILSIASIYEETLKLKNIHQSDVIMVTLPNAFLLEKHTQFPNDINVFRFNQLKYFSELKSIIIHIPEYRFNLKLQQEISIIFRMLEPQQIHLNILNQNLDLMPNPKIIQNIKSKGFKLTQTTAHEQYSTEEIWCKYKIPLHKLSVYATPSRYNFTEYNHKENLILISPDLHDIKESVLAELKRSLPEFKIEIIENISYLKYLQKIEKAKYMITFGEGLDFYFIETVFSGGISFAVFNDVFFTDAFKDLDGVYNSYDELQADIVESIRDMDKLNIFNRTNQSQFITVNEIYNDKFYKQNLRNFYLEKYMYDGNGE